MQRISAATVCVLLCVFLTGCGAETPPIDFGNDGATAAQIAAAKRTAETNTSCTSLGNFYWEIGNVNSILASGSTGSQNIVRTTMLPVASASKWMFAAYVFEYRSSSPSTIDKKFLKMSAGYNSFASTSCGSSGDGGDTVGDCQTYNTNDDYTAANDGKFFYGGGHYQKWAVDNGMTLMSSTALTAEYRRLLGSDVAVTFVRPQLAGGITASAAVYTTFLRKLISKQLRLGNSLGAEPTCTVPGSSGCTAVSSPITTGLHYSFGHWIEDDPGADGAFSSPGLFGYYPWIDSTKKFYGVIARADISQSGEGIGAGQASMMCGRKIRAAFRTGIAQ